MHSSDEPTIRRRLPRARFLLLFGLSVALLAWFNRHDDGCATYFPSDELLVAHAGGGLPEATYTNSLAALDLAAKHGFRLVEIDFQLRDGGIVLAHDREASDLTFAGLLQWLENHPSIIVITDAKTDNIPTLRMIARLAGSRANRFQPQIYHPDEYIDTASLGMQKPIFTAYRVADGWQPAVNQLDVAAVTIPVDRRVEAARTRHPVFLHTVNVPLKGFGLYTDCLIPR